MGCNESKHKGRPPIESKHKTNNHTPPLYAVASESAHSTPYGHDLAPPPPQQPQPQHLPHLQQPPTLHHQQLQQKQQLQQQMQQQLQQKQQKQQELLQRQQQREPPTSPMLRSPPPLPVAIGLLSPACKARDNRDLLEVSTGTSLSASASSFTSEMTSGSCLASPMSSRGGGGGVYTPVDSHLDLSVGTTKGGVPSRVEKYTVSGFLGRGSWAVVHLCADADGRRYALKSFDKSKMSDKDLALSGRREAKLLRLAQRGGGHPGLVGLLETLESPQWYHLVVEFAGRDSQSIIERAPMTEAQCRVHFRQLLQALHFIHSEAICHRDIKPSNILISGDGLKLSDFGLGGDCREACSEICGTPDYTAPEIVAERKYDGCRADMWSSGVTLYAFLTGKTPWSAQSTKVRMRQIQQGSFRSARNKKLLGRFSSEVNDLMDRLLVVDPQERMTAAEALSHPFFTGAALGSPVLPPSLSPLSPSMLSPASREKRIVYM